MKDEIVRCATVLTLLGGGAARGTEIALAVARSASVVAVDSGAEAALEAGLMPEAVIGDFDSLSEAVRVALPPDRLHRVEEQDSTDFEKALERVQAPLILGVGFTGHRRDHELAALHGLLRFAAQRVILLSEADAICLCPPDMELDLAAGTRVSLFPMMPVRGRSEGLAWPIAGIDFAPGVRIGTSNAATGGRVRLRMDRPGMLLLLPLESLDELIAGMQAAGRGWPGPGEEASGART